MSSREKFDIEKLKERAGESPILFEELANFIATNSMDVDSFHQKVYVAYSNAIARHGRAPLSDENFYKHFFKEGNFQTSVICGNESYGYLFGSLIYGIFVPTHFAPFSIDGGILLIDALLNLDAPVALFITDDLVRMIKRIEGYTIFRYKIKKKFRGEEVDKYLVVNDSFRVFSTSLKCVIKEGLKGYREKIAHLPNFLFRKLYQIFSSADQNEEPDWNDGEDEILDEYLTPIKLQELREGNLDFDD